jgi:hypothetical protein
MGSMAQQNKPALRGFATLMRSPYAGFLQTSVPAAETAPPWARCQLVLSTVTWHSLCQKEA